MQREHRYIITNKWTGNTGVGTKDYMAYQRDHVISAYLKPDIHCSSDPAFRGDVKQYSPEELFVASLSSCHMLWYLHLCAEAGIVVIDYIDKPEGVMIEEPGGGGRFTEVTLYPVVTITDKNYIDRANELHIKANKLCFIANSCNFPVRHSATCITT